MDSFLDFNPNIAVILNVELDHVDYFEDIEHIKRSYREFAQISLANKGFVVANGDDRLTLEAVDGLEKVVLFGVENKSADVRAENTVNVNGCYSFDLIYKNEYICKFFLFNYSIVACLMIKILKSVIHTCVCHFFLLLLQSKIA